MSRLPALPIDPLLPELRAALARHGAAVLMAPPGAGKTTRVPRALLDEIEAGGAPPGEILVVQPRRLPARMAALRVAGELGEEVGARCGYTVRFDSRAGPRTRIHFVTEGILMRRLFEAPGLPGVAAVVLDEFHERHLDTDLALGLLAGLRRGPRPDLRLLVMSATLEPEPIADYLSRGRATVPILRSEGRSFPVAIRHVDEPDPRPLEERVAGAVRRVLAEAQDGGDILVFLPGAAEIRRAAQALEPLAAGRGLLVLPLHGDLPLSEQSRVVAPARQRKLILSTNVAETSVTIDGVTDVIDTGLSRVAAHSPWTGLPALALAKISQAAAAQRAGRAGRTRAGRALRLYGRHDLATRPLHEAPEVARLDLAGPVLTLATLGVTRPGEWDWFERPPDAALAAAERLLRRLGALADGGAPTPLGRELLRLPVHPRLARLVVEGGRRGVAEAAAVLAAILSERDLRLGARATLSASGSAPALDTADLLEVLDRYEQAAAARFSSARLRALELDPGATEQVRKVAEQLARAVEAGGARRAGPRPARDLATRDGQLALCALAGFPDRVARRREPSRAGGPAGEALLAEGGAVRVGASPAGPWLVALDVQERATSQGMGRGEAQVRLAVAIEPEALLEVVPDEVIEERELAWNPELGRVDERLRTRFGALVLEETRRPARPGPEAAAVLLAAVRARPELLEASGTDPGAASRTAARLRVVRAAFPERELPAPAALASALDEDALAEACRDSVSLAELRARLPAPGTQGGVPAPLRALLAREAPERITLPGGRSVEVHYEDDDRPPWIASRLQDFFGLQVGPAICSGRVPLVLHLLAPNQRAVQVTRDLAGFWRQHYPALRRELGRRYPRHPWPEDGARATPPAPRPPRPR